MEKRKVSTFLANEEKKRLLKSGKDSMIYGRFPAHIIHLQKDDRLFKKHDRVFKKDDRVLKKRGHPSIYHSERRIAVAPT